MAYKETTMIQELTVSELVCLIETTISKPPQLLRGVQEICNFLGVSKSTFYRLRNEEPNFDKAIIQNSYLVLADPSKLIVALEEISNRHKLVLKHS